MKALVTANPTDGVDKTAKLAAQAFDFAERGLQKPAPVKRPEQ